MKQLKEKSKMNINLNMVEEKINITPMKPSNANIFIGLFQLDIRDN